jgi:hypothetical protein
MAFQEDDSPQEKMTKRLREEDLLERVRDLCDDPTQITVELAVDEIREHGFKVRGRYCVVGAAETLSLAFLGVTLRRFGGRAATDCCVANKGCWWWQGHAVPGCVHVPLHVDLESEGW